jgi:hypothetical protein
MARVKSLSSSEKILRSEPDFYTLAAGVGGGGAGGGLGRTDDDAPPWVPPSMASATANSTSRGALSILEPTPIAPQHRHTQSAPTEGMPMMMRMMMPVQEGSSSSSLPPSSSSPQQQPPFAFGNLPQPAAEGSAAAAAAAPSFLSSQAYFEALFREGFVSHFMGSASASAPTAVPSNSNRGISFQPVVPTHQVRDRTLRRRGNRVRRRS